eukprot:1159957-Pelagomonas_calceolata.AAC.13
MQTSWPTCPHASRTGVLSGEKQRLERNYNFVDVVKWFASRCDLIFMLFDPNKLDISDEFKQVRVRACVCQFACASNSPPTMPLCWLANKGIVPLCTRPFGLSQPLLFFFSPHSYLGTAWQGLIDMVVH